MAEFYSSYGHAVDLTGITGSWTVQGPQNRDQIPDSVRGLFDNPDVVEVAVKTRNAGFVIHRNDEGGQRKEQRVTTEATYTKDDHRQMVESRVHRIDYFMAECPCGWRDKFPSLMGAELHLIDHYKSKHRWVEGQPLKCGKDVGSRPEWMGVDQYDPCPCLLDLGHDGGCACDHTDSSLGRDSQ